MKKREELKIWPIISVMTVVFIFIVSAALYFMRNAVFEGFKDEIHWATEVALAAINPSHVDASASLLGSGSFIEDDDVKRLKEELESLGNLFLPRGVDAIYLIDKKATEIYFLVESTPFGEEGYVVPGSLYREAPADLYGVFSSRESVFTDIYTDEYGTYFSEFSPVLDRDGAMIAALGVDVSYDYFNTYLFRLKAFVLGIALAIYLLLILIIFVFERKAKSDQLISQSNSQIKSIIDSIPSSLIAFDSNQKIVFWNHSCNEIFGLSSGEAFGRKISDIVRFKLVTEQLSGQKIDSFNFSEAENYPKKKLELVVDSNNKEIILETSFNFFTINKEKIAVALFDDITLKKQKDKELEEQRDKFEKMNSLMLDRELKMVELKSEIAKIKEACNTK